MLTWFKPCASGTRINRSAFCATSTVPFNLCVNTSFTLSHCFVLFLVFLSTLLFVFLSTLLFVFLSTHLFVSFVRFFVCQSIYLLLSYLSVSIILFFSLYVSLSIFILFCSFVNLVYEICIHSHHKKLEPIKNKEQWNLRSRIFATVTERKTQTSKRKGQIQADE